MEIWVSSRTKTEDYTWRTSAGHGPTVPPPSVADAYDKWKFEDGIPWFGLVFRQDSATLSFGNLEANREDSRGRPIVVHAVLQAGNETEVRDLLDIVSALLVRERELLPQWAAYLLGIFDDGEDRPFPAHSRFLGTTPTREPIGRFVYPREDALARESIAGRLGSGVDATTPLAVGTTGRSGKGIFERVCNSGGKWQAAFFSSTCEAKSELPVAVETRPEGAGKNSFSFDRKGGPKKFPFGRGAGTVACLVLLALVFVYAGVVSPGRGKGQGGPGIATGQAGGCSGDGTSQEADNPGGGAGGGMAEGPEPQEVLGKSIAPPVTDESDAMNPEIRDMPPVPECAPPAKDAGAPDSAPPPPLPAEKGDTSVSPRKGVKRLRVRSPALAEMRGDATYKETFSSKDVQPPTDESEDSSRKNPGRGRADHPANLP